MAGIGLNRSRQAPAQETPSFGSIAERFRRAGDLDRAIALCEEGLKKFPNQLSARVTLGWSLLDKGEYDLARKELEKVLRRAPDNLAAIRGLAELHDRAEHAVSGYGPDGTWVAPEEPVEEPAAPSGSAPVAAPATTPAVETRVAPVEFPKPTPAAFAAMPVKAAQPVRAVASATASAADVNPLSLIETPAQAAIAHSAPVAGSQVESVFEQVSQASDVVTAASDVAGTSPVAFEEIDPVAAPPEAEVTTLDGSAWEIPTMSAADDDSQPVLLADAEIELAQVASELAVVASEPVAEPVIDLPSDAAAIESAFHQFEESVVVEPFDASDNVETLIAEAEAYEVEALDPEFPLSAVEAVETVELVNEAEAVAIELEPEIEIVAEPPSQPDVEAAEDAVADIDFGANAQPAQAADIEVVRTADVELDVAVVPEPEPVVELEPQAAEPEPVFAAEPERQAADPDLQAVDSEPEVVESEPQAAQPELQAAEPEREPQAAEPEPEFVNEAIAAFQDTESSRPMPVIERFDAPPLVDEVDAVAVPDEPWVSPVFAERPDVAVHVAAPLAAAALVDTTAPDELLQPAQRTIAPARPTAAPIAALEAFLQKVSARRLHLTPGSVA